MPNVEMPPLDSVEGGRKELYELIQNDRGEGRVSSLFQAYGCYPEIGKLVYEKLITLFETGTLTKEFKETLMVALSEINECDTCISFHGTAMKNLGVAEDAIDDIRKLDIAKVGLSEKEQALFEFAMKTFGEAHSITREDCDELREKYGVTDREFVEVWETINTGNAFNLVTCASGGHKEPWYNYNLDDEPQEVAAAE